jgi:CARDB protein
MGTNDTRSLVLRLSRIAVLLGIVAASLMSAGVARAVDDDPDPEPPPNAGAPNLLFTAYSVAPFGTSQWEVRYTVANRGITAAPAFHVAIRENGGATIEDRAQASLAAHSSRSEVIHVNRTGCYLAVRLLADSTHVVRESSELDNERVVSAMTSPLCPQLPKYKVKAVSFRAIDETGPDTPGSNEPYWVTSTVGTDGSQHTEASHVFGSIDSGDTASFGATELCMYLSCAGGAAPFGIGFSVQLWEQDDNDLAKVLEETKAQFPKVGALSAAVSAPTWVGAAVPIVGGILDVLAELAKDDLIASQTYAYSPDFLAARLPTVGTVFTDTRRYEDTTPILGGAYELRTTVTRVA